MEPSDKFNAREKALAFGTAMSNAVLLAIREERAAEPVWLDQFESALAAGEAQLAIFIRRDKDTVYVSAGALPAAELKDPLEGHRHFRADGPVVQTLEEFQAMTIIDPTKRH